MYNALKCSGCYQSRHKDKLKRSLIFYIVSLCLSPSLHLSLSLCLAVCPSLCLTVSLSLCLSVCLSVSLSLCSLLFS